MVEGFWGFVFRSEGFRVLRVGVPAFLQREAGESRIERDERDMGVFENRVP